MGEIAREIKVVTQMGNQGTSRSGLRRSAAIVQAVLGPVQGSRLDEPADLAARRRAKGKQAGAQEPALEYVAGPRPKPSTPTAMPRSPGAGWWDFGTGALATWPAIR